MPTSSRKMKSILVLLTTVALVCTALYFAIFSPRFSLGDYGRPGCNVLLISIDTLRSDHLGCYGYERSTSPNIDLLSDDGVTFLSTSAQAPSTTTSHASLFTSLLPSHHGAFYSRNAPLPAQAVTMAELLQGDGYQTVSFNDGAQLSAQFGFAQGFDQYTSVKHGASEYSRFEDTVRSAVNWLENREEGRFFLFLHSYHTHHPYTPEKRFIDEFDEDYQGDLPDAISLELLNKINRGELHLTRKDKAHIKTLYDAEIRQMDQAFSVLVEWLKQEGIYRSSLVIFTSDHGEEFGEHGIMGWHSHTLYDELLRVPLIIKFPGNHFSGKTVGPMVRSIDILPTILDIVDIPPLDVFEGQSLMELVKGRSEEPRPAIAQQDLQDQTPVTLRSGNWKYYRPPPPQEPLLFELGRDPLESLNVAARHPEILTELEQQLALILARLPEATAGPRVEVTEDLKEQLRSLGYTE